MRSVARRAAVAVSLLFWFGFLNGAAVAQTTGPPTNVPNRPARTFATLTVNGKNLGDALIGVVAGDVFLRVTDLAKSGIAKFAGTRQIISGEEYVSLRSLQPEFTYTFDLKTLALDVIAHSAGLLGSQVLNLSQGFPVNTTFARSPGAFLNYALSKSANNGGGAFLESGVSFSKGLLYDTVSYEGATHRLTRGLSELIFDSRPKLRRIVFGDAPVSTGLLGGGALLGGVVVARQFGLDPYLVTFPTPQFRGQVLLPSQADVYVNGQLVRTVTLDPGEFVLQDIPSSIGYAQTTVVIRNAAGTTTQRGQSLFSTFGLLRPGLSDYAFGAGFIRGASLGSPTYGRPAVLARYAVGISNRLTAGARIEAKRDLASGGLSVVRTFGKVALGLAGAASRAQGVSGAAGSFQITAPSRGAIGFGASLQWQSDHYATLSMKPSDPRSLVELNTNVSAIVSRTTALSASLRQAISSKDGPTNTLLVSLSQQLGRKASLFVQMDRIRGQSPLGPLSERGFSVSLTRSLGENANLGISTTGVRGSSGSSQASTISFTRNTPGIFGLGYGGNAGLGNARQFSGLVRYSTPLGGAQAFFSDFGGISSADLSYDGGMAIVGKHVFLTRTIGDAYGLVEVPGLGGAAVTGNGRFEGYTNREGLLLLPDLASDVPNDVSVSLPQNTLDATMSETTARIAPGFRSAVIFPYTVQRIRSIILTVQLKRKDGTVAIPQYGQLTLSGAKPIAPQVSETDGEGRAYFNDLAPGTYAALVEFRTETCKFTLDVPSHDRAVTNLGTKTCIES